MRLTIEQSHLHAALQVASRATASRSTLPALAGVLLVAEDHQVRVVATDLEMAIEALAPAQVEEGGSVVLPGRPFHELIRRLSEGEVRLEVDADHRARVEFQRSRFTLHGMAPRLFPAIPRLQAAGAAICTADQWRRLLRRTTFAVSHDASRPILTGVSVEILGDRLRALATDSFRIAVSEATLERPVEGHCPPLVIPGRSLMEVARLLPSDGMVRMIVDSQQVGFQLGEVRLISRLIEGIYPKVLDLVPNQYPTRVRLATRPFQEACERASLMSDSRHAAPWLIRITVEPDRVVVTARDPDLGEVVEEVPATVEGQGMTIGFNARYLLDGLKAIEADEVYFELTDPLQASRLRGVDVDDFFYIVLPVKIG